MPLTDPLPTGAAKGSSQRSFWLLLRVLFSECTCLEKANDDMWFPKSVGGHGVHVIRKVQEHPCLGPVALGGSAGLWPPTPALHGQKNRKQTSYLMSRMSCSSPRRLLNKLRDGPVSARWPRGRGCTQASRGSRHHPSPQFGGLKQSGDSLCSIACHEETRPSTLQMSQVTESGH